MAILANRVKMTVSGTPGTGTITLGSAVSGFQSFADGVSDGDVVRYVIEDGSNWEIGTGTYTSTGTTLTRTVLESSNADAAVNLSSSAVVFIGAAAEDIVSFEGGVVINESGDAVNFRVESDTNSNMISVSGINNEVGIGRSPNGYELDIQGSLRTSSNAYITGTLLVLGNTILGTDSADDITVNGTISANSQSITPTELGYIANVTSDVQAQLDSAATTGKAIAMAMIFG